MSESKRIKMPTIHIMIDFEAWDKMATAKPRSLGLVSFGNEDLSQVQKYWNIDQSDYRLDPCTISPSTVKWWDEQGGDAQQVFTNSMYLTLPITEVLSEINDIFKKYLEKGEMPILWANGADYDIAMINHLFRICEMEPVWFHSNVADMRTVRKMFLEESKIIAKSLWKHGTKHFALHDAKVQASILVELNEKYDFILPKITTHHPNGMVNPDYIG